MTTVSELEHLLSVEELHTSHFAEWAERATDPLARVAFRMAADKEANHVEWVRLLLDLAERGKEGGQLGVGIADLQYWIADENGEGESDARAAETASEPWVRAVLAQIAEDEKTNARLLELVLARATESR